MNMSQELQDLHREASRLTGKDRACGVKVDYQSEATALKAVVKMNDKMRHPLEPYPCYWCKGWHIGRVMTVEEMREIIAAQTSA